MAIATHAASYLFSDMLVKDPEKDKKDRDVKVNLTVDQLICYIAVGLPLMLLTLAFTQEMTVGTPISCFPQKSFSWPQVVYINSYCWASIQRQNTDGVPLWLHKFFPYVMLLAAILLYLPALFWRFTAAQTLSPDLSFIMNELDRSYNRAVNLAKCLHEASIKKTEAQSSFDEQKASCNRFPIVDMYLETKSKSRTILVQYLLGRLLMLAALLLSCFYLYYYIHLSGTDEFLCEIPLGGLVSIPEAVQCKLVAVSVFSILCYVNLVVYALLVPVCVYAILVTFRSSAEFLTPYTLLENKSKMEFKPRKWDDLSIYLMFLQENLNQLKSYKCLKVLEVVKDSNEDADVMELLLALAKLQGDEMDGKKKKDQENQEDKKRDNKTTNPKNQINQENRNDMNELFPLMAIESHEAFRDEHDAPYSALQDDPHDDAHDAPHCKV